MINGGTLECAAGAEIILTLKNHPHCSNNSYVTRIGVINKLGWLLTLTSGPQGENAGHYQQIDKQEESLGDQEESLRELGDTHEYEEVQSDEEENNNNIHSVKNNNLRTRGNVARKFSQVLPSDSVTNEEMLSRIEVCEGVLGQLARPSSILRDHPIHSLTESDIEKAVRGRDNSRGGLRAGGQLACYIFAITLTIFLILAVVFIVTNIVSNMYIRY